MPKWNGTTPTTCNLCHDDLTDIFFDAILNEGIYYGRWALICQSCFVHYNCRLGTGSGQKYNLKTLEKLEG